MGKKKKKAVPLSAGVVALPNQNKAVRKERKALKEAKRKRQDGAAPQVRQLEESESEEPRPEPMDSDVSDSEAPSDVVVEDEADGRVRGRKVLEYMLAPISLETFYEEYYEKKPLLIQRKNPEYFDGWLTKKDIDTILREQEVRYTHDVDVAKYVDKKRRTLNPHDGRATAEEIWDFHEKQGCTVRMLCPVRFCDSVWKKNASLQEFWGCMAGANCYLTPPNAQGFAPHYDDVEVYILQTEGRKHWRVYPPRCDAEMLARTSSRNFTQEEIGDYVIDTVLEQGDTLYMPRAFIHQAWCMKDIHSLHLTISTNQLHTWYDYLQKALPAAVSNRVEDSLDLRRSLPRKYAEYLGAGAFENKSDKRRTMFRKKAAELLESLVEAIPFDEAADDMCKHFIHQCLPPNLTEEDESRCAGGDKAMRIDDSTEIRMVSKYAARMVVENGTAVLYFSVDNPRAYWTQPPQKIDYDIEVAPSLERVVDSYPEWIAVDSIPMDDDEGRRELVQELFDLGIVMAK